MWLAPPKRAQLFLASDQVNLMVQKVNLLGRKPVDWAAPFLETVLKLDTYCSLQTAFLCAHAGTS